MDFKIRKIEANDNPQLATIIRTVMPEFGASGKGFAIHDKEVDEMFETYSIPRAVYFVVELDGKILGGGGIGPLAGADADTCELRKMYFLPVLRGHGAGQAIIEKCISTAREVGYKQCYLETLTGMDAAQHLYNKNGFKKSPTPIGKTGHFGCDRFFVKALV